MSYWHIYKKERRRCSLNVVVIIVVFDLLARLGLIHSALSTIVLISLCFSSIYFSVEFLNQFITNGIWLHNQTIHSNNRKNFIRWIWKKILFQISSKVSNIMFTIMRAIQYFSHMSDCINLWPWNAIDLQ